MAEQDTADPAPVSKKSRKPLLFGLILMCLAGGGAFWAVRSGLILGHPSGAEPAGAEASPDAPLPEVAYVALDPIIVSFGGEGGRHLRFVGQLEVAKAHRAEVESIRPRVTDVLNTYLRAVDMAEFEKPESLIRLRAQMLRRIKMVAGEGRVRDLLVSEYVIN